ncbi:MAG: mechanosensitive ion channel family protein [Bacteroidales bacterium]|nr:mechanosensitive ion channel family protein [Bacteroidales bacterium]
MNKSFTVLFFLILFSCSLLSGQSQDKRATGISSREYELLKRTLDSIQATDSAQNAVLINEVSQLRLREATLLSELEGHRSASLSDSAKKAARISRIDSLRSLTKGAPLIIDHDTILVLYAPMGGVLPEERVEDMRHKLRQISKLWKVEPDSIYLFDAERETDIMYKKQLIMRVSDEDALWMNVSREELASAYRADLVKGLTYLIKENSIMEIIKQIFFSLLIICGQVLFIIGINVLYRRAVKYIGWLKENKLHPISIKGYEFFNVDRQARLLQLGAHGIRLIIDLIMLMITLPFIFYIFPPTKTWATTIYNYILIPVKMIGKSIIDYLPNLFTIVVIIVVMHYLLKGLRFITNEIEAGRLKINGFYQDWAQPTFNLVRFLLYIFTVAIIYPYLPGSDSNIFKGLSVFVGLIVSLGSTSIIANIGAGFVITYMRPFKIGDRIKLNETVGFIVEKSPLVTRIKTPKNEIVTVPNSFILTSVTTNYSTSAEDKGLIIHSTVSIGYDVPWRQVHELLIDAAKSTPGVLDDPKPFVLQTELSDYYPVYQVNAYIKDVRNLLSIYSILHENIQDKFNEAGVEIMSPHYRAERDGNTTTIPEMYWKKDAKKEPVETPLSPPPPTGAAPSENVT